MLATSLSDDFNKIESLNFHKIESLHRLSFSWKVFADFGGNNYTEFRNESPISIQGLVESLKKLWP